MATVRSHSVLCLVTICSPSFLIIRGRVGNAEYFRVRISDMRVFVDQSGIITLAISSDFQFIENDIFFCFLRLCTLAECDIASADRALLVNTFLPAFVCRCQDHLKKWLTFTIISICVIWFLFKQGKEAFQPLFLLSARKKAPLSD